MALIQKLQQPTYSLAEFASLARSLLVYFPNIISRSEHSKGYVIHKSEIAGSTKYVRPINEELFINDPGTFDDKYNAFNNVLTEIKNGRRDINDDEHFLINSTLYTIQQSIGAGFDLLSKPNSARKHVGNRFEELMRCVFTKIGISNKRTVLKIPYQLEGEEKIYKCENDIILSPYETVKSDNTQINPNEVVVSLKTTSKDRMGKMFIDKMLLENFTQQSIKIIGIFHNDVQRKSTDNISYTLVSGLFLVYTQFLTELEGVYYVDLPPKANQAPFDEYLKPVSVLLEKDIWELLGT